MYNKQMINEMSGAFEMYAWLDYKAKDGDENAIGERDNFVKEHHHEICVDLAETFYVTLRDFGYSQSDIYKKAQTIVRRCESGAEPGFWEAKIGKWFLGLMNNNDDDNTDSIGDVDGILDPHELGACLYDEAKKYCQKYRAKLDKNNAKRREAKTRVNESKQKPLTLNENTLRNIVKKSFDNIFGEICKL